MRGHILAVPDASVPGAISGDDGQRYRFSGADLNGVGIRAGQAVDFVVVEGEAREIYPIPGQAPVFSPALSEAIRRRDWFAFYFNPHGRFGRRDYWIFGFLVLMIVNIVLDLIPGINVIVFFVTAWCGLALGIKRCHDVNRSGWLNAVPYVLTPLAFLGTMISLFSTYHGNAIGLSALFSTFTLLSGVATFGFWIWFISQVLAKAGDAGPNRFGVPPVDLNA
ncbi:DUF805 domain-containing protein [Methylobacterium sp. J-048]|uniref:DUF805 domain-containing protein n=1 Tax=Methylobacterium sp. J-048 TaxID=2836635 RepID=UPI001FB89BB9|nr:DUF805 domain-containing protein [Methylobacterium sp. J-048]MCJ2060220.1 DUF805 domain-containing protein [Methylobacterium sp. J-048]